MFSSSKLKIVTMVPFNDNGNNSKSVGRKRNDRETIVVMVRIVIVIAGMSTVPGLEAAFSEAAATFSAQLLAELANHLVSSFT